MNCIVENVGGSYDLATKVLRSIIMDNYDSLLDLCCCHAQITGTLGFKNRRYVDIIERKLSLETEQEFFVQADVLQAHPLFEQQWGVVTCLDGIEHVTKEQGFQLRDRMLSLGKTCIVFTPSDPWCMEEPGSEKYEKDPESHKSIWSPNDFPGWASINLKHYHPTLNIGAFFSWFKRDTDMQADFERVMKETGFLCQA